MQEDSDYRALYAKFLISGGLLYPLWGVISYLAEHPDFADFYWRIPVGLFAILCGIFQKKLKNYFIFLTQVSLTLFVIEMAAFLAYTGQERYMYGAFVVLLLVFIGFLNHTKAFLVHAVTCSTAYIFFTMYTGVFSKYSSPIRQVVMFYGFMYILARLYRRHTNMVEKLRAERLQLLNDHSQMITDNLKNAQSVFTALTTARGELPISITLKSFYKPASEAGGDWLGHFYLKEKNWLVLSIGDVTGHDLASSLVTIAVAGAARGTFECFGHLAKDLNELVHQMTLSSHLAVRNCGIKNKSMTAAFIGIDLNTFQGVYANCAHPSALMTTDQGVVMLDSNASLFLGDENFEAAVKSFDFSQMKSILLYTDGLIETKKLPISEVRLKRWFGSTVDFHQEVSRAFQNIFLEDDVSLLLITREQALVPNKNLIQ